MYFTLMKGYLRTVITNPVHAIALLQKKYETLMEVFE